MLTWWGHVAHDEVDDAIVDRVQARVLDGMGLVVLHSGHFSKIFKRLMGTTCNLKWREADERERIWVVDPGHPIAAGLGEWFEIEHEEMYGEHFDVPAPDRLVLVSWFQGGEVFRSGCCYQRGRGRIFYFRPGHETHPTYHQPMVRRVISNAVEWAAEPAGRGADVRSSRAARDLAREAGDRPTVLRGTNAHPAEGAVLKLTAVPPHESGDPRLDSSLGAKARASGRPRRTRIVVVSRPSPASSRLVSGARVAFFVDVDRWRLGKCRRSCSSKEVRSIVGRGICADGHDPGGMGRSSAGLRAGPAAARRRTRRPRPGGCQRGLGSIGLVARRPGLVPAPSHERLDRALVPASPLAVIEAGATPRLARRRSRRSRLPRRGRPASTPLDRRSSLLGGRPAWDQVEVTGLGLDAIATARTELEHQRNLTRRTCTVSGPGWACQPVRTSSASFAACRLHTPFSAKCLATGHPGRGRRRYLGLGRPNHARSRSGPSASGGSRR